MVRCEFVVTGLPSLIGCNETHGFLGVQQSTVSAAFTVGSTNVHENHGTVGPTKGIPAVVQESVRLEVRSNCPARGNRCVKRGVGDVCGIAGSVWVKNHRHIPLDGGTVRPHRAESVRTIDCSDMVRGSNR